MHEATEGNRVVVMEAGKIVLEGTPEGVFEHIEELRALQLDVPQTKELAYRLHQRDPTFPTNMLMVEHVVDEVERRVRSRSAQ
jgi:ABC-type glutathione transport system ATPase component